MFPCSRDRNTQAGTQRGRPGGGARQAAKGRGPRAQARPTLPSPTARRGPRLAPPAPSPPSPSSPPTPPGPAVRPQPRRTSRSPPSPCPETGARAPPPSAPQRLVPHLISFPSSAPRKRQRRARPRLACSLPRGVGESGQRARRLRPVPAPAVAASPRAAHPRPPLPRSPTRP